MARQPKMVLHWIDMNRDDSVGPFECEVATAQEIQAELLRMIDEGDLSGEIRYTPLGFTLASLKTESKNFKEIAAKMGWRSIENGVYIPHVLVDDPIITIKYFRILHAAMGLCTESGELMDALKRYTFYGDKVPKLDESNIAEELGDMLWYMCILMDVFGWSFEQIMNWNVKKLQDKESGRYKKGCFIPKDAVEREPEKETAHIQDQLGDSTTKTKSEERDARRKKWMEQLAELPENKDLEYLHYLIDTEMRKRMRCFDDVINQQNEPERMQPQPTAQLAKIEPERCAGDIVSPINYTCIVCNKPQHIGFSVDGLCINCRGGQSRVPLTAAHLKAQVEATKDNPPISNEGTGRY